MRSGRENFLAAPTPLTITLKSQIRITAKPYSLFYASRAKTKKQAAQGEERAAWLAKSSGEEEIDLHRRWIILSRRRWRRRRLVRIAHGVGHQAYVHAAIIGAALSCFVRLHRLVFAQPDHINLVRGHVVFRGQILNHGIRPPLAQIIVVLGRSHGVRASFQRNDVTLGAR